MLREISGKRYAGKERKAHIFFDKNIHKKIQNDLGVVLSNILQQNHKKFKKYSLEVSYE